MSFFDLFRKKEKKGGLTSGHASSGFQFFQEESPLPRRVYDLRSDGERQAEKQAQSALGGEDEELARKMVNLVREASRLYSQDKDAYDKTCAEIRKIGEHLCNNGGHDRMAKVAYRVQALGARVRDCEFHWDGICGWMY